jgi:hypothetical protein
LPNFYCYIVSFRRQVLGELQNAETCRKRPPCRS